MVNYTTYYLSYINTTNSMDLLFNPQLEHSRFPVYIPVYDQLTNSYALSVFLRMQSIFSEFGFVEQATLISKAAALLDHGLSTTLLYNFNISSVNSSAVTDIIFKRFPEQLFYGLSWVNLGAVPGLLLDALNSTTIPGENAQHLA
eukprot:TRINITY_DN11160_c0_g1_i1.p1 TRINITY_DN11160_c0_g1~~TRINITY_DN11160_c0_g1_i1.p1  ORF type:complete len:145 (+),score=30.26 TRINITY_DN11160_c0_g1_i1:247-681(+)